MKMELDSARISFVVKQGALATKFIQVSKSSFMSLCHGSEWAPVLNKNE